MVLEEQAQGYFYPSLNCNPKTKPNPKRRLINYYKKGIILKTRSGFKKLDPNFRK